MPNNNLAIVDVTPAPAEFAIARPPAVVLEEAHKAAKALKDVIDQRPRKIVLNGQQYLTFEDWSTLARFYGVTAKIVAIDRVSYGEIHGFMATAVALRADGVELSSASAQCLTDEAKWRSRPKYEERNGRRVKVGDEPVPLFQLASMAQTRASAKVLRTVLAWIVVLAGYSPTPAEEVEEGRDDGPDDGPTPDDAAPARTSRRPQTPPPARKPEPSPGSSTGNPPAASTGGATTPATPPPVPTPAARPTTAQPASVGMVAEVREVEGGALIKLVSGFVAGTRDAEIIAAAKSAQADKFAIDLVTRAAAVAGRAPTIIEINPVRPEGDA